MVPAQLDAPILGYQSRESSVEACKARVSLGLLPEAGKASRHTANRRAASLLWTPVVLHEGSVTCPW